MTMPVLGPIPGARPLMVGEDYILDEPTPMQWDVLQESLYNHHTYLQEQKRNSQNQIKAVGIDAAPLVAFIDEITSQRPLDRRNSKYATIAAVVGISSGDSTNQLQMDTSSNTGFMESIIKVFQSSSKETLLNPLESKVRLVGIGRASLSHFHSQLPHSNIHDSRDSDQDELPEAPTPIIVAQFQLLYDSDARSSGFVDAFGRSRHASPVHTLNEMHSLSNRITSLHEDRKRLLRGLQAAKARLKVASTHLDLVLEDLDGLGMLHSGFTTPPLFSSMSSTTSSNLPEIPATESQIQEEIDTLLESFPEDQQLERKSFLTSSTGQNSLAKLLEMENYGMGISSASFSRLPGMTRALAEKLQPYYSSGKHESEEHYYEVFSFMGVLSLGKFVQPADLDWALKCTNTIERMQWVYDWMWSHKSLMIEASEEVSNELRECGEECTDLW